MHQAVTLYASAVDSPFGPLGLAVRDEGVAWVGRVVSTGLRPGDARWPESSVDPVGRLGVRIWVSEKEPMLTGALADSLTRYFAGDPDAFRGLPMAPAGTPFQLAVWEACARVPFGETISYTELAKEAGHPNAARAVGQAMQRNPVPLVVPCHRVVGKNDDLVGYSLGGIRVKKWLLEHERSVMERAAHPV
jgi:methylated-DNA-[protein]-cysteine S-methyltransferase